MRFYPVPNFKNQAKISISPPWLKRPNWTALPSFGTSINESTSSRNSLAPLKFPSLVKTTEMIKELLIIDEQFKVVRFKTKMLSFHLWRATKKGRLKRFKIVGEGGYYYSL